MRRSLLAVGLLALVAAAEPPASQPAEKAIVGWANVVKLIPRRALPAGGKWDKVALEDARAALKEKLVGATVTIKGKFPKNVGGGRDNGYVIDTGREGVSGIDCEDLVFLKDGTDLHGFSAGQAVTVTGRVSSFEATSSTIYHRGPLLKIEIEGATIRKG